MNEKEKSFVSAVVYVRNNAKEIKEFAAMLLEQMSQHFEKSEVIFVNDASEDESVEILKEFKEGYPGVTISVLHMSYYHGLELSMNAGTDFAIGDYVYEFDSVCMDYPKELIWEVFEEAQKGYDIVSASPDKKMSFFTRVYYQVFSASFGGAVKMQTERFRVLSRRVINRLYSVNKVLSYRKATYAASGLPVRNMKYQVLSNKRVKKDEKYRRGLAVDSLILYTEAGYHFSMTMTVLMMLIMVLIALYAAVIYLIGTPMEGWTTTVLFMAFGFFGLFGILTIIVKYLSLIVRLLFKRQHYLTEGIEKITK